MTTAAMVPQYEGGVLIASPSTFFRERFLHSLGEAHWPVQEASGGADALVKLESGNWQVLYLDRRLPDLDAEELMAIIRMRFPGIQVVMVDSDGALPAGVQANHGQMGCPATSFDEKLPHGVAEGSATAGYPSAAEKTAVEPLPGMIGSSEPVQSLYRMARLIAARKTTVLIVGATGTGKELVARAIHRLSARAAKPLVIVNCAAIPDALLESELFGYTRGAFTGAVQSHAGRIQAAQGGTLFLDEIAELPLSIQPKLLRFLEQKEVQRLGSTECMQVDVRVLAASNVELEERVEQGRFRADLYYRLAAFPLTVPSLAERGEDIVSLAEHFLSRLAPASRQRLSADAIRLLRAHAWEGNVRELQYAIERAFILAEGGEYITAEHLAFLGPSVRGSGRSAPRADALGRSLWAKT